MRNSGVIGYDDYVDSVTCKYKIQIIVDSKDNQYL